MTEPLQITLDGEEVPYRRTLPPSPNSDFRVDLWIEAGGDVPDLKMFEATGEEDSDVQNAKDLVDLWRTQYNNPSDLISSWFIELDYDIRVKVLDPNTGNSTTASWSGN